jgi:hypothetical protein
MLWQRRRSIRGRRRRSRRFGKQDREEGAGGARIIARGIGSDVEEKKRAGKIGVEIGVEIGDEIKGKQHRAGIAAEQSNAAIAIAIVDMGIAVPIAVPGAMGHQQLPGQWNSAEAGPEEALPTSLASETHTIGPCSPPRRRRRRRRKRRRRIDPRCCC